MKKAFLLIFVSICLLMMLTSCDTLNAILGKDTAGKACEHEWAAATCVAPRTCSKCGETRGDIGDHDYSEATCTSAGACKTCGIWYGLALGHVFSPATCEEPKTCKVCNYKTGDPVHEYTEATCTAPNICGKCGNETGEPLGHKLNTVVTEPTCAEDGSEKTYCLVCDATVNTTLIPKANHEDLPFEYNGDATSTVDGTVTAVCPYCDYTDTQTLVGSSALIKEAFAGKKISILGDSISTYIDISTGIAADTTNSTIRDNLLWYGYQPTSPEFGGASADSTWWQRTINALGASRLVNNSNSGESVFRAINGRCMQLHDDTGDNAGEMPDIIFVYLGTNDNYCSLMGDPAALSMTTIERMGENMSYSPRSLAEAYAVLLYRIQKTYPDAEIYCLTNLERSDVSVGLTHSVCEVIRGVVDLFDGIYLADIALESGIAVGNPDYETYIPKDQGGKSIHPGVNGMEAISRVLLNAILENSRYIAEDFNELLPKKEETVE